MLRSLVGSEMCIRDRCRTARSPVRTFSRGVSVPSPWSLTGPRVPLQVVYQGYLPAVREVLAMDAVSPYLVRKGRLVHLEKPDAPEEIRGIRESEHPLDAEFPGLLEACSHERRTFPLSLEFLLNGQGPDCLLYTSDAADDLPCVALGGRPTIKKKTQHATFDTAWTP